jgi:hypothetical protein
MSLSWNMSGWCLKIMFGVLPSISFAVRYLPSPIHSAPYSLHTDSVATYTRNKYKKTVFVEYYSLIG